MQIEGKTLIVVRYIADKYSNISDGHSSLNRQQIIIQEEVLLHVFAEGTSEQFTKPNPLREGKYSQRGCEPDAEGAPPCQTSAALNGTLAPRETTTELLP